jgi:hypothetical protein
MSILATIFHNSYRLTVVSVNIHVFGDMTLCRVSSEQLSLKVEVILWNVGNSSPDKA